MYKDSCCAQATMQSVNAFSRETLAASASCQAGRNKVYQKKGKKRKLLDIFSYFFPAFLGKERTRSTAEQGGFPGGSPYSVLVLGALNVPGPSHFLQQSQVIINIKQHMVRNRERVTRAALIIDQIKDQTAEC